MSVIAFSDIVVDVLAFTLGTILSLILAGTNAVVFPIVLYTCCSIQAELLIMLAMMNCCNWETSIS